MAFTEIDEKLLVRAYQAGDERAFDTIVRTQYNALYAHAYSRLKSHESAEDAVQDTLLRAYRALSKLDGDLALKAWLHRILTNVCHDEGNRRRRQQGLVEKIGAIPEELAGDPAEEAALYDTVRIMSQALEELPESYREALVLRYVDGLSFREVAEAAGVTEENARARVHRGRLALHKIMARVAIIVAFLVPGLKRTQHAATGAEQAIVTPGLSEQTISLTTQLTSHAIQAAPVVSRFAEMSAAMPGGKSALAAAAVTAVAAVTLPVAYTVNEVRRPEPKPAAVAAPAPESDFRTAGRADGPTTTTIVGRSGSGATVTSTTAAPPASTTSTTLPPSLRRPFEIALGVTETTTPPGLPKATTTTTTTSTTTAPPPVDDAPEVEGRLEGPVTVTGAAPQFDLAGEVTVMVDGKTQAGSIEGRLYVNDDGTASSDGLDLAVDGTAVVLKFRGRATPAVDAAGATVYELTGTYVLKGGDQLGLPERGTLQGSLRDSGDGTGLLAFDFSGQDSS